MQNGIYQISFDNGSTIVTPAIDSIGCNQTNYTIIAVDEAALMRNDALDMCLSLSFFRLPSNRNAKKIVLSTPRGMNRFADLSYGARLGTNEFKETFVAWRHIPGLTQEWANYMRETIGAREFVEQFECVFSEIVN